MKRQTPKSISAQKLNEWLQCLSTRPYLVDVREKEELRIAAFPANVIHLPLSQMQSWSESIFEKLPIDRPLVVICHAGIRSENFGTWLLDQDFGYEVWNLAGGIDSWSLNVDRSVPRY